MWLFVRRGVWIVMQCKLAARVSALCEELDNTMNTKTPHNKANWQTGAPAADTVPACCVPWPCALLPSADEPGHKTRGNQEAGGKSQAKRGGAQKE